MTFQTVFHKRLKPLKGNTTLLIVRRTLANGLRRWLARHLPATNTHGAQAFYTYIDGHATDAGRLRHILTSMGMPGTGINADRLISDMLTQAAAYRKLMNLDSVGLRIDFGTAAIGWHTDRDERDPRLLVTYHGPGTQWLRECDVEKREIHTNAIWVNPDAKPQCIPAGYLALLKGGRKEGVVHRSPPPSGEGKRLLVIFEPPTEEHLAQNRYTFKPSLRETLAHRC